MDVNAASSSSLSEASTAASATATDDTEAKVSIEDILLYFDE